MRKQLLLAAAASAAIVIASATPALADVTGEKASADQGVLVHGNGGAADVGTEVTGDLGSGPKQQSNYVHFTGSTTVTTDVLDANNVMLQQGGGQAELTGAIISGNNTYQLQSGDIFLSNHDGMNWIELAFAGVTANQITFTLALTGPGGPEADQTFTFAIDHSPSGENKFAFSTSNGESITNLFYQFDATSNTPGTADDIRQVRIIPAVGPNALPEPGTWAMMLLGFGVAGVAMRRSRRKIDMVSQLA